jgi:hypothetical protein
MEDAVKLGLLILVFAGTVQMMGCGAGYSAARQTSTGTSGGIGPTQPSSSQHRVDLFWAASTSPNVSGYNIYRAAYTDSCGSFTRINAALVPTMSYTDSEVTGGAAYCYAGTALNTSSQESDRSDIVSNIQIPTN